MRKYLLLVSITLIFAFALTGCNKSDSEKSINCPENSAEKSIRVMSFNIRLNTTDDGPNQWPYRKEYAASMVRFTRQIFLAFRRR